jgi:hypothetical protein
LGSSSGGEKCHHVGADPVRPVGSTVWRTARKVRKPFSTARSLLKGMKTL